MHVYQLKKTSLDNTNNYNNRHGDYFLTMSLRINTENAKYAWCAVKRTISLLIYCKPLRYMKL
jgi:hypothetical protein